MKIFTSYSPPLLYTKKSKKKFPNIFNHQGKDHTMYFISTVLKTSFPSLKKLVVVKGTQFVTFTLQLTDTFGIARIQATQLVTAAGDTAFSELLSEDLFFQRFSADI